LLPSSREKSFYRPSQGEGAFGALTRYRQPRKAAYAAIRRRDGRHRGRGGRHHHESRCPQLRSRPASVHLGFCHQMVERVRALSLLLRELVECHLRWCFCHDGTPLLVV